MRIRGLLMPRTPAQMTGMLVTAFIAFGTDMDVFYSVPLGVMAGMITVFFVTVGELRLAPVKN
jgi:hypothetical protein